MRRPSGEGWNIPLALESWFIVASMHLLVLWGAWRFSGRPVLEPPRLVRVRLRPLAAHVVRPSPVSSGPGKVCGAGRPACRAAAGTRRNVTRRGSMKGTKSAVSSSASGLARGRRSAGMGKARGGRRTRTAPRSRAAPKRVPRRIPHEVPLPTPLASFEVPDVASILDAGSDVSSRLEGILENSSLERVVDDLGGVSREPRSSSSRKATGVRSGVADAGFPALSAADAYLERVHALVKAAWIRPPAPSSRGRSCSVRLRVASDGRIDKVETVSSSGYAALDESAVLAVKRVGALPPPPPGLLGGRRWVEIVVEFVLKEGGDGVSASGA